MKIIIFLSLFALSLSSPLFLQPYQSMNSTNTTTSNTTTSNTTTTNTTTTNTTSSNTTTPNTTTAGPKTINQLTSSLQNLIPNLQGQMQNNPAYSSSVVQSIVSTGLKSFMESGSIQQSNGVFNKYIKYYLNALKGEIKLPSEYSTKFDNYISKVLEESNGTWVEFSVVFSLPKTEQMKFVCIFAKNNPKTNNSDWIVANIQDAFKLVSTTIMETKSCQMETRFDGSTKQVCTTSISSTEKSATENEIECVIDFLEIAAYKKIISQIDDIFE